jgi:hypothetical protein
VRWLHQKCEDFYKGSQFDQMRTDIEFRADYFSSVLLPQITGDLATLSADDRTYARQIDNFLNYFESIFYLVDCRQLDGRDVEAMFEYWLGVLKRPDHRVTRIYARNLGYERLARHLCGDTVRALVAPPTTLGLETAAGHVGAFQVTTAHGEQRTARCYEDETATLAALRGLPYDQRADLRLILTTLADGEALQVWTWGAAGNKTTA